MARAAGPVGPLAGHAGPPAAPGRPRAASPAARAMPARSVAAAPSRPHPAVSISSISQPPSTIRRRDQIAGRARLRRDDAAGVAGQGVGQAALAGVDLAREHHPPGLGQPEADPGRPEEPVDGRLPDGGRKASAIRRNSRSRLPAQLPAEDLGGPRARGDCQGCAGLHARSRRGPSPEPGRPGLADAAAGDQALHHRLGGRRATVAVHLQLVGRPLDHDEFFPGARRRSDCQVPTAIDPSGRSASGRPPRDRNRRSARSAAPGPGEADHRQAAAAGRRQQGDARERALRLHGSNRTRGFGPGHGVTRAIGGRGARFLRTGSATGAGLSRARWCAAARHGLWSMVGDFLGSRRRDGPTARSPGRPRRGLLWAERAGERAVASDRRHDRHDKTAWPCETGLADAASPGPPATCRA